MIMGATVREGRAGRREILLHEGVRVAHFDCKAQERARLMGHFHRMKDERDCLSGIEISIFASRMTPFTVPPGYTRIRMVDSFDELITARFGDGVNALCWRRTLAGDFGEVVERIGVGEGIVTLDEARLLSLPVSAAGRAAIGVLLEDQRLLREHDMDPVLNCIHGYPRDEDAGPVPTDVFSFHADSAPVEADTWLCTYHGLASEGLRNDEAQRRMDIPETRAELLRRFGGADDGDFLEYLNEHCYDLHYAPVPQARPFSFGLGNLWRIATEWPGSPVPPCVHRAPETLPGEPPRLLLIS
jgi:hypothetical protein